MEIRQTYARLVQDGPMAARHPAVAIAVSDAIGWPHAPRGALSRLAEQIDRDPSIVSRWHKRQSSPEPAEWPAIEAALGLRAGALERVYQARDMIDQLVAMRPDVSITPAVHEALARGVTWADLISVVESDQPSTAPEARIDGLILNDTASRQRAEISPDQWERLLDRIERLSERVDELSGSVPDLEARLGALEAREA